MDYMSLYINKKFSFATKSFLCWNGRIIECDWPSRVINLLYAKIKPFYLIIKSKAFIHQDSVRLYVTVLLNKLDPVDLKCSKVAKEQNIDAIHPEKNALLSIAAIDVRAIFLGELDQY